MAPSDSLPLSAVVFGITAANSGSLSTIFAAEETAAISSSMLHRLDSSARPLPLHQIRLSSTTRRIDFETLEDLAVAVRLLRSRGFYVFPIHEIENVPIHISHDLLGPTPSDSPEWSVFSVERSVLNDHVVSDFYCSVPEFLQGAVVLLPSLLKPAFDLLLYHLPFNGRGQGERDVAAELLICLKRNNWEVRSRDSSIGSLARLAMKLNINTDLLANRIAAGVSQRESLLMKAKFPKIYRPRELLSVFLKLKEIGCDNRREPLIPEFEGERPTRALELVEPGSLSSVFNPPNEDLWDAPGPVENCPLVFKRWQTAPGPQRRRTTTLAGFSDSVGSPLAGSLATGAAAPGLPRRIRWDEMPSKIDRSRPESKLNRRGSLMGMSVTENVPYPVGSAQSLGDIGSGTWGNVLSRLQFLVDTAPGGEIPLLEIDSIYSSTYSSLLNPALFGYADLKTMIIASPILSLVWIYNTPPSKELLELRKLLNLELPSQFSEIPNGATILHNGITKSQTPDLSGPVPLDALRVRQRCLTVNAVSQDVIVALVAHWVLMHETKAKELRMQQSRESFEPPFEDRLISSPSLDSITKTLSRSSTMSRGVSSIGMPLSLLARTWDANWSNVCTLSSLLERSGVNRLDDLVRSIPAFEVRQSTATPPPPKGDVGYHESLTVIYLKKAARIPVIPELIPDPTVPAYDAPRPGDSHLVFFPPLFQSGPTTRQPVQTMPLVPVVGWRKTSVKEEVLPMLFELVAVCCEWQKLRWSDGEDFVEFREQQVEAEVDPKLKPTSGRRQSAASAISSHTQMSSDDSLEDEEYFNLTPEERIEHKRLKKKERRESNRRRRSILREWCRTIHESHKEGDTVEALINAAKTEPKETEGLEMRAAQIKTEVIEVVTGILKGLENIKDLDSKRKEYRNRSVGIFVSSIKLEWSKYFDNSFPLTYFMERCGAKKLKSLLAEVPNLILTGDGGFMRVATVEHTKILCDPFPPRGFDSTGTTLCPSYLTAPSSDARYQISTYISSLPIEESSKIKSKAAFFKRLNLGNATTHKRKSILDPDSRRRTVGGSAGQIPPVSSSVSAVWELPTHVARSALSTMLVDLVVLHAIKQRSGVTTDKKETPFVEVFGEGRESYIWEKRILTREQKELVETFKSKDIEGLKIHEIPSRWNSSFVRFSPFSSFLKKAGFDRMGDPQFQRFVCKLSNQILITTSDDGTPVLFPGSLEVLDDPSFQRPANLSIGVWLKRKSMAYLNMPSGESSLAASRRASTSAAPRPPPVFTESWRGTERSAAQRQLSALGSSHSGCPVGDNGVVAEVTRRLRSIEADVSDQTAALINLSRMLSIASKKSKKLPSELMDDISTIMATLRRTSCSILPSSPTPAATAIARRWSSNNVEI